MITKCTNHETTANLSPLTDSAPTIAIVLAIADVFKRLLVGKPIRSERLGHQLLPKRLALPVFASDALSSVAYAPDEILLTLSVAGFASMTLSPWIGLAVVVVMIVVIASYRQNVRAYPSGGGDYEVATVNLGRNAGLGVGSALLVDYVMTVAVSISSGSQYAAAAIPALKGYETLTAILLVVLLTGLNLRGIRQSGRALALPVYCFIGAIGFTAAWGFVQSIAGTLAQAESAGWTVVAEANWESGLTGLAGVFLILRAFSSGCAALTGVEAVANGVPAFRPPKSKNAATTLLVLGVISVTMLISIIVLAQKTGVQYVEDPRAQLVIDGKPAGDDFNQNPVIGQIAEAVFAGVPVIFYVVAAVTGVILVLAANTAFAGFPVLASILARDGYLPRQMQTRGDRLAFSNGILLLAAAAIALIWVFDAQVTRLIQLYIVGVFISFTLGQAGMVRHWTRLLATEPKKRERRRMRRSRMINAVGLGLTGTVLVVVLITKFTHGAWIALTGMAILFLMMKGISRHYDHVKSELALGSDIPAAKALPSRVHAIVLVSRLHKPTMRALAYARATRPSTLEAVNVATDHDEARALVQQWEDIGLPVPLRILDSPYREVTRPVIDYVRSLRRSSPRDLVVIYVPEYVVGHWWEQFLHNQSSFRLKSRLHFTSGIVIASVPWQLDSSTTQQQIEHAVEKRPLSLNGDVLDSASRNGPSVTGVDHVNVTETRPADADPEAPGLTKS